ncbi:hypothetical protein AB0J01_28440 [Streptomyces sp. NPDC050204]|uniref:hypothetical protein n=1 Tax=Streptomyces sp. NPDC050204 TaxID=3155514 RepID=UPI00342C3E37
MAATLAALTEQHLGKLIEVDDSVMHGSEVLVTATRRVRLLAYQQLDGAVRLQDGSVPQWPCWIEWAAWRTFRVLD